MPSPSRSHRSGESGARGQNLLTPHVVTSSSDGLARHDGLGDQADLFPHILITHGADRVRSLVARLHRRRPRFVCVIATTDTSLIPGISAAGASPDQTMLTPAADAEIIVHGRARCITGIPSNPLGPPGPALITRAALELAGLTPLIVNAGCRVAPDTPCIDLGGRPGGLISDGIAVPDGRALYKAGLDLGKHLASTSEYLVVGESVPGGTTTALAVLLALGVAADGRVSSSLAGNAHDLKNRVARAGLAHLKPRAGYLDPLGAVETLGDPMQPVVAGIAAAACESGTPVLLAGGTQMVAVLALLHALARAGLARLPRDAIAIATTRWVTEDPTADIGGLLAEVGGEPLLATRLSFTGSAHPLLRRYEDYLVKEGVGAGGACVAAHLTEGISCEAIQARVDSLYTEITGVGTGTARPEE